MIGWILKRVLLIFISWVGAIGLILLGLMLSLAGCVASSPPIAITGIILLMAGLFIRMFAKALEKWIEVKYE